VTGVVINRFLDSANAVIRRDIAINNSILFCEETFHFSANISRLL